jgi:DNA-binding MarR family transcriptional regulator
MTLREIRMDPKTLSMLKEFEKAGTVPMILVLDRLGKGRFTDIYYESISMGFRVGSGVVSRSLDRLCRIGWAQKIKNKERNRVITLTERGSAVARTIKKLIKNLKNLD